MPDALSIPDDHWRSRWLQFNPRGQRLHRVAEMKWWDDGEGEMIRGDGASVCGRRGFMHMPGIFSRMGGGHIRTAWAAACRRAGVVATGPHVLRHSFASWHYAIHRDLLRLRDAVGWSSVDQVERYAHLMPAGHEDAIRRVWGDWQRGGIAAAG